METEALPVTPLTSIDPTSLTSYTAFKICPTVIPDTRAARAEAILCALESFGQQVNCSLAILTHWARIAEEGTLLDVEVNGETICKIRLVP